MKVVIFSLVFICSTAFAEEGKGTITCSAKYIDDVLSEIKDAQGQSLKLEQVSDTAKEIVVLSNTNFKDKMRISVSYYLNNLDDISIKIRHENRSLGSTVTGGFDRHGSLHLSSIDPNDENLVTVTCTK
jgi:hypothetical protein